eukprot:m.863039 g.863039  ORF g.863039 m.863039 type:complete len:644 (+) comp23539_c0_seq8:319-2250(+)
MASSAVEIVVIVILALVAVVCATIVVFLLRWLKKYLDKQSANGQHGSRGDGGYEDELTESSMVADLGVFAPTAKAPADLQNTEDWDFDSVEIPPNRAESKSPSRRLNHKSTGGDSPRRSFISALTSIASSSTAAWNPTHIPFGAHSDDPDEQIISPKARTHPHHRRTEADGSKDLHIGIARIEASGKLLPRTITISSQECARGLGLSLADEAPVHVHAVAADSPSADAGIRANDRIISVAGTMCAAASHTTVIKLLAKAVAVTQQRAKPRQQIPQPPNLVVGAAPMRADAALSDVNVSLPGQASHDHTDDEVIPSFNTTRTSHGTIHSANNSAKTTARQSDTYASLRDAASHHQIEAATLMKAGQFRQARALLDKAIDLLSGIPHNANASVAAPAGSHEYRRSLRNGQHSSTGHATLDESLVHVNAAAKKSRRRTLPNKPHAKKNTRTPGFRCPRQGISVTIVPRSVASTNRRRKNNKARDPVQIRLILRREDMPGVNFRPIRPVRLSRFGGTLSDSMRRRSTKVAASSPRRAKPGVFSKAAFATPPHHSPKRSKPDSTDSPSKKKGNVLQASPWVTSDHTKEAWSAHKLPRGKQSLSGNPYSNPVLFMGFEINAGHDNVITTTAKPPYRRPNKDAYVPSTWQ